MFLTFCVWIYLFYYLKQELGHKTRVNILIVYDLGSENVMKIMACSINRPCMSVYLFNTEKFESSQSGPNAVACAAFPVTRYVLHNNYVMLYRPQIQ